MLSRFPRLITILIFSLLLVLLGTFVPSRQVLAYARTPAVPILSQFIGALKNGQPGELRGVYIPKIMAMPIVQQPEGQFEFVSPQPNLLTQFSLSEKFGTTGLLAHNYLAGARFFLLKPGQILYLVYGDGKATRFVIRETREYQALDPLSTTSRFLNLKDNAELSARQLLDQMYKRPGQLIFQTCIARGAEASWGRLFVIAEPLPAQSH
jgi:hypothetical protein